MTSGIGVGFGDDEAGAREQSQEVGAVRDVKYYEASDDCFRWAGSVVCSLSTACNEEVLDGSCEEMVERSCRS